MRGVAERRIPLDRQITDEMYFCLACRACESACPAGVRYGHLIESMRADIAARHARPPATRVLQRLFLRRLIGSTSALRAASGALRFYQRRGLQSVIRRSGVLRLVPGLVRAESLLPPVQEPFRPPLVVPAHGKRRGRVALFSGCIMPELFGHVNAATLKVLTRNGFEVSIPRDQRCCGALHLHSGDLEGAKRLLRKNRRSFRIDSLDAVVVNSAGCGVALKEYDDEIAGKVRDLSEFLYDAGLRPPAGSVPIRVAYNDACHLLHGQRIAKAPRALLGSIPGLELFDLPGTQDCCGAAGIYNLTHVEMAQQLVARKVDAIRETSPDAVATGNPGCMLQIGSAVRSAGLQVEVVHPVELLARSYR
jgi:glycolate oxidase iron-sulfur subunit